MLRGRFTRGTSAPQSGEMTRDQIQQKGIELREQTAGALEDAVSQARLRARRLTASVRGNVEDFVMVNSVVDTMIW